MNPDMAFSSNSGLDVTMAPVAVQATHVSMAPAAVWPEETSMVPDG